MAKRNRITKAMSQTIAESSPLVKTTPKSIQSEKNDIVQEVSINDLKENPYQPRINIDHHKLNELVSSIEKNGLLQSILVAKNDGQYIIIAGHRRVEAFKILGKQKIQVKLLKNVSEQDLAILSLSENIIREDLHPIENALSMKYILDKHIVSSQNKLSEYLGLSKGYVSKMINILKLPNELSTLIKNDNYRDINILIIINKLNDLKTMTLAYNEIKNLSRQEAENHLMNTYFEKPTQNKYIMKTNFTKEKISLSINTKNISNEKMSIIKNKIEEIEIILKENR